MRDAGQCIRDTEQRALAETTTTSPVTVPNTAETIRSISSAPLRPNARRAPCSNAPDSLWPARRITNSVTSMKPNSSSACASFVPNCRPNARNFSLLTPCIAVAACSGWPRLACHHSVICAAP